MAAHASRYTTRQFQPADVTTYKAIRLEALHLERGMYGNSYEKEAAFTNEEWLARLSNPNSACFGLFDDETLIGLTGIFIDQDKPGEAYMTQSYIRKAYRGKKLSRLLYQARLDWAKERNVQKLLIGHRESNITSKMANQRFGFSFSHRESRLWPDDNTEDMLYYTLEL